MNAPLPSITFSLSHLLSISLFLSFSETDHAVVPLSSSRRTLELRAWSREKTRNAVSVAYNKLAKAFGKRRPTRVNIHVLFPRQFTKGIYDLRNSTWLLRAFSAMKFKQWGSLRGDDAAFWSECVFRPSRTCKRSMVLGTIC